MPRKIDPKHGYQRCANGGPVFLTEEQKQELCGLLPGLDPESEAGQEFLFKLAAALGGYRAESTISDGMPTKAETRAGLAELGREAASFLGAVERFQQALQNANDDVRDRVTTYLRQGWYTGTGDDMGEDLPSGPGLVPAEPDFSDLFGRLIKNLQRTEKDTTHVRRAAEALKGVKSGPGRPVGAGFARLQLMARLAALYEAQTSKVATISLDPYDEDARGRTAVRQGPFLGMVNLAYRAAGLAPTDQSLADDFSRAKKIFKKS